MDNELNKGGRFRCLNPSVNLSDTVGQSLGDYETGCGTDTAFKPDIRVPENKRVIVSSRVRK